MSLPPRPRDDQNGDDAAGEHSLARGTLRLGPVLRLLGSTTAVGAFLLVFGYLSTSSLFGFAGLPVLSFDYVAMVEAGAAALIDSIGLALGSFARLLVLLALLASAIGVWLYRDHAFARPLAASPVACLVAQTLALLLVGALVAGMVDVARQASPASRGEVRERAEQEALAALDRGESRPTQLRDAVWKVSYELSGFRPWRLLNVLVTDPGTSRGEESQVAYGQPVRLSAPARARANDFYGWLFLTATLLFVGALALRAWRSWLDERHPPEPASGSKPSEPAQEGGAVAPQRVLATTRQVVEPLLLLGGLLALALLPIAHGVLAYPGIGREEVIVSLRRTPECLGRTEKAQDHGVLGLVDLPPWREPEPSTAATPASDPSDVPADAADEAAGEDEERARAACLAEEIDGLEEPARAYAGALVSLMQMRDFQLGHEDVVRAYRQRTDELLEAALALDCRDALQQVWLLRPHPAIFDREPEAAQHFWNRWRDAEARSGLRFGHILHYPRGEAQQGLLLFEPVENPSPIRVGRWTLREIPRACIDETTVVPDLVEARIAKTVARVVGAQTGSGVDNLRFYLRPVTLTATLQLLRDESISHPQRGALVSLLGTLAGLFQDYEPRAAEESIDVLGALLADPQESTIIRGMAATALHLARGPYAADQLTGFLDSAKDDADTGELRTTVTAAGLLAHDVWTVGWRFGRPDPPSGDLARIHDKLFAFLGRIARTGSGGIGGAACTALHNSRHPDAGRTIIEALQGALERQDLLMLAPCVTSVGESQEKQGAPWMVRIVSGEFPWIPDEVREAAFASLYEIGLTNGRSLVSMYRTTSAAFAGRIAMFLEDGPSTEVAEELLRCLDEAGPGTREHRRCLHGFLLLDVDEDGDDLVARLVAHAKAAVAADDLELICDALNEYRLRGGFAAGNALRTGLCDAVELVEEADQRERWRFYVKRARSDLANGGSASGPLPSPGELLEVLDLLRRHAEPEPGDVPPQADPEPPDASPGPRPIER